MRLRTNLGKFAQCDLRYMRDDTKNGNKQDAERNFLCPLLILKKEIMNSVTKKIFLTIFGLIFAGIGFFALSSASNMADDYKDLTANGTKTTATVTEVSYKDEVQTKNNRRTTVTYESTTIIYKDSTGATHTIKDREQVKSRNTKVGQEQVVYYDAENPARAVVDGKNDSGTGKFLGIIFIAVGLGISVTSGISFLRNRSTP